MESKITISAPTEDIKQAILASLICRKARNKRDKEEGKAGWWGDYLESTNKDLGSYLWTLERSVLNQETLNQAKNFTYEALQWLKEDRFLSSIEISTKAKENRMEIEIKCV